ncbi:peritrophin-1-like, partial [Photinus pyralis]|uniref:peritrophin-1-like n=1 Tax=Photinus pyralis TaxID=7054 RepID=UPI00126758FD
IVSTHDNDNCTQFYKCDNAKKILHQCPQGLFYNPEQSYCDWPQNVNCVKNTTMAQLSVLFKSRAVDSQRFCPLENPDKNILYPHESNCSIFYKCFNGHLVPHACPPNLYYNPDREYCDWSSNVKCYAESQTEGNNLVDCPLENPEQDILYPHESKCNVFYKCSNGEKVPVECFPGLYFNPKKNFCDWPENVTCAQ